MDGASTGRTFDCIGGLSGGGGTSRLLYDYPPQQQSEILDYLFKPNYGASLQILKVEIGGDVDTTNGAEASHERSSTDANYHRGYEWWLMQQAKVRNPNIKLYGLQWGTPGWVNGTYATAYNWYSTNDIPYVVDWLKNAQSVYGLTIDYIGGQNKGDSVGYAPYFEALKAAITAAGLEDEDRRHGHLEQLGYGDVHEQHAGLRDRGRRSRHPLSLRQQWIAVRKHDGPERCPGDR